MKLRHQTPEQVICKVTEGQKPTAAGKEVAEVARYLEVTPATWYRWVNQCGGMKADDAKGLKELEKENQRLRMSWPTRPSTSTC